jgi:hypothetical protein
MKRMKHPYALGVGDPVSWVGKGGQAMHGKVSYILEEFGTDEIRFEVCSLVPNLLWTEEEYFTVYPNQIVREPYKETNA